MKDGKWHPISERLSRQARIQLLKILLKKMERKKIAKACDVTVQAVSNWIHKQSKHPGNKSSKTLLRLSLGKDPKKTEKIIRKDIERYFKELKEFGMEIKISLSNLPIQKN